MIRATRGRGILLSSEARNVLGVRGPYDVMNLAQVWGLGQERGKEALCEEAGKVVKLAGMKRTSFRGVVDVIDRGAVVNGGGGGGGGGEAAPIIAAVSRTKTPTTSSPRPSAAAIASSQTKKDTIAPASTASGTKRKASSASLNGDTSMKDTASTDPTTDDTKPLSKREQKRREKKAKFEARAQIPSGS